MRVAAPWRSLPMAPVGAELFTTEGMALAAAEVLVFLPLWVYAFWPRPAVRSLRGQGSADP